MSKWRHGRPRIWHQISASLTCSTFYKRLGYFHAKACLDRYRGFLPEITSPIVSPNLLPYKIVIYFINEFQTMHKLMVDRQLWFHYTRRERRWHFNWFQSFGSGGYRNNRLFGRNGKYSLTLSWFGSIACRSSWDIDTNVPISLHPLYSVLELSIR